MQAKLEVPRRPGNWSAILAILRWVLRRRVMSLSQRRAKLLHLVAARAVPCGKSLGAKV